MTKPRQIFVDSNIIIDIAGTGGQWTEWSMKQVSLYAGTMSINPVIYSELCSPWDSVTEVDNLIAYLGLNYLEIPKEALFLAAQAFKLYRLRGGSKTAPLPDFFIGAHAAASGVPIITRNVKRYKAYFPTVTLISPQSTSTRRE